jgi:hypothetical protein
MDYLSADVWHSACTLWTSERRVKALNSSLFTSPPTGKSETAYAIPFKH